MNKIAEQARLRASLEESARFGSPVDLSVADTEVEDGKVQIEQVGWVHGSHLFELQDGRVACMVDIAVTNQTSRTIHVVDVELRATWEDSFFEWLLPVEIHSHAKRDCSYSVYRFPGPGPEFACKEVINHHLLERRRLPAKLPLEGWLLGIGGLMPPGLHHGQWQDMRLTIIAADHAEYSTTLRLWTERLLARTKIGKTRTSIFAKLVEEEAVRARDITCIAALPASSPPAWNRT